MNIDEDTCKWHGEEAAAMRKELYAITASARASEREAEQLLRIVEGLRPRPFTITQSAVGGL